MKSKIENVLELVEYDEERMCWIEQHTDFRYTEILEIINAILDDTADDEMTECFLNFVDFLIYREDELMLDDELLNGLREIVSKF